MSSVFSSNLHSHLDLSFLLPSRLQGIVGITGQVNYEDLETLVSEITTNWDSAEFIIQAVKENPELGKQLLPQIRDILPDDSWQKAKLLGLCGEEEDLRRAINLIASDFHHDAAHAAMGMLSRGVGQNLQNEFEESLLKALDNVVLSNSSEVTGVDKRYRHNALERVAGDRWEVVEKAWEAELISDSSLLRLAAYTHLPVWIRAEAVVHLNELNPDSIAPILERMEAPSDKKLCEKLLALIEKLPPDSVSKVVITCLEWESAHLQKRILHSLLGHPLRP
jgi:hypothetical protein